eukprot:Pgem_evm1s9184
MCSIAKRRRRDIFINWKDLAEDAKDILFGDGLVVAHNYTVDKDFNMSLFLLNATQDCFGVTLNEQVRAFADGQIKFQFGFHFKIVFKNLRLQIQEHYTWIQHESDLVAGLDLDINAFYQDQMTFNLLNHTFKEFHITGICTIAPSMLLDVAIDGLLNASMTGQLKAGFHYDNDTVTFNSIGELIKHPKDALIGSPIIDKPTLKIVGDVDANVNVTFVLKTNAAINLSIPLKKRDPYELVEGNVGIKAIAGLHLLGGVVVSDNMTFNNIIPDVAKPSLDKYYLTVDASVDILAYFDGYLMGNQDTLVYPLWSWSKELINLQSEPEPENNNNEKKKTNGDDEKKKNDNDNNNNNNNNKNKNTNSVLLNELAEAKKELAHVQGLINEIETLVTASPTKSRRSRNRR